MIKSANPALNVNVFRNEMRFAASDTMTIQGTVNKTGIMLLLLVFTASFTWNKFFLGQGVDGLMIAGGIVGFITALTTIFKKSWAPITAPLYALAQGLFLGGLSAIFEM